jgi:hypothetical protein
MTTPAQVQILEEITLVAPFGVRFWDVSAMAPAQGGLTVVAYPDAFPGLRSNALENRSGVYSFSGLPGLRRVENGKGDDAFWAANPPTIPYTVEVTDFQDRYLPFLFSTLFPVRGIFGFLSSPVSTTFTPDSTWLPVFSTPSRALSGPSGVIRAQLQDDQSAGPAAWALLTAQPPGGPAVTGLADDRGMVTLTLSYPEPPSVALGSPMGPGTLRLTDQSWLINVTAFYTPGIGTQGLPDLEAILQQKAASIWRDTNHSALSGSFTLQYGNDLVLRSLDSASGQGLPVLLITLAGSPP